MEELRKKFTKIPWSSFGRRTGISELARSILPVGNFSTATLPRTDERIKVSLRDPNYENYMMEIEGAAFQVGRGKLLTCWHVCNALRVNEGRAYVQATAERDGTWLKSYWRIITQFSFIDPRTNKGNKDVDVGTIICPAIGTEDCPYDVPIVKWGDSTQLGVGDQI